MHTIEVWEWISNFYLHFVMDVITYPCCQGIAFSDALFLHDIYGNLITKEVIAVTHWGWYKIEAILQTTFSNAFYWTKMYEFQLLFPWS